MFFSNRKVRVKKFALVQYAIDANCAVVVKDQIENVGKKAEYGVPYKISIPRPKGSKGKAKKLMGSILLFSGMIFTQIITLHHLCLVIYIYYFLLPDDEQTLDDLKEKHDSMELSNIKIRELQAQTEDSEDESSVDEYPDSQPMDEGEDESEGDRRSTRIRTQKEKEKKTTCSSATVEPSKKKAKSPSADEKLLRTIKEQRIKEIKPVCVCSSLKISTYYLFY